MPFRKKQHCAASVSQAERVNHRCSNSNGPNAFLGKYHRNTIIVGSYVGEPVKQFYGLLVNFYTHM